MARRIKRGEGGEDVPPAAAKDGTRDRCCLAREVLGVQPCVRDRLDVHVAAMRAKGRKFHDHGDCLHHNGDRDSEYSTLVAGRMTTPSALLVSPPAVSLPGLAVECGIGLERGADR